MNLKRLHSYIKEIINWLFEARLAFLCVSILLLSGLISFYTWPTEQSIRATGYVLQLFGMIFAIRGVLKIREHFGHPTIKCMLIAWFKRIPKWRKSGVFIAPSMSASITGMDAIIEVWSHDKPEETLEKRLESILRNLNNLRETQRNHSNQLLEIKKEHKKYIESQNNKINNIKVEINTELEKLHTNDILVSLIGLVWLAFGITLSTLPSEILQFTK